MKGHPNPPGAHLAGPEAGGLEVAGSAFVGDLWILYAVDGERGFGMLDTVCLPGYQRYGIEPRAL